MYAKMKQTKKQATKEKHHRKQHKQNLYWSNFFPYLIKRDEIQSSPRIVRHRKAPAHQHSIVLLESILSLLSLSSSRLSSVTTTTTTTGRHFLRIAHIGTCLQLFLQDRQTDRQTDRSISSHMLSYDTIRDNLPSNCIYIDHNMAVHPTDRPSIRRFPAYSKRSIVAAGNPHVIVVQGTISLILRQFSAFQRSTMKVKRTHESLTNVTTSHFPMYIR